MSGDAFDERYRWQALRGEKVVHLLGTFETKAQARAACEQYADAPGVHFMLLARSLHDEYWKLTGGGAPRGESSMFTVKRVAKENS